MTFTIDSGIAILLAVVRTMEHPYSVCREVWRSRWGVQRNQAFATHLSEAGIQSQPLVVWFPKLSIARIKGNILYLETDTALERACRHLILDFAKKVLFSTHFQREKIGIQNIFTFTI
jgi:hypothetical protein